MDINVILEIGITIVRWIALICLMGGLIYIANQKIKIQIEFAPIFVFSSIAVLVFLGGICGFLFI